MRFLTISLIFVSFCAGLVSCTSNYGEFLLVNNSSEEIAHIDVLICGQTIKLRDIKPTESANGSFKVTSDSHYVVQVEFRSGKTLVGEDGYVTNGMNFRHKISVTDTEIKVTGGGV